METKTGKTDNKKNQVKTGRSKTSGGEKILRIVKNLPVEKQNEILVHFSDERAKLLNIIDKWEGAYTSLKEQWDEEIYNHIMLSPVKHNERMLTNAVLIDYSEANRQYNPEATHLLHILTELDNVETVKETNAVINQFMHRITIEGVELSDIEIVNTITYKTNKPYPFSGNAAAITLELKVKGYETQASKGVAYSKFVRLNQNGNLSKVNANNRYEIRNPLPGENLRVRVLSEKTDCRYTADELMNKLGIEGNVLEFTHDWDFEEAENYLYILKIKRNI